MEPIATALSILGGQAVLLAAVAWLGKGLLTQVLAKELEEFKANLGKQTALAIEQTKHELQLQAAERQVVFTALHARRAEVLAQLHALILEVTETAETLSSYASGDTSDDRRRKYIAALDAIIALGKFFRRHRLYIPDAASNHLVAYLDKVHKEVTGLGVHARQEEAELSDELMQRRYAAWGNANEYVKEQLPSALLDLESEFRKVLGAQ